jgi:hypothetical protein
MAVLGLAVSLPVAGLILMAELLTTAGLAWFAVRALRQFRSLPWPRSVFPAGATS